jgi:hypothetical protein
LTVAALRLSSTYLPMSRRAKVHEVSSPISLFPFIGILLCTMGALLVVLVAVSRSAKDSAEKHVAARQQAGASAAVAKVAKKLTAVRQYSEKLGAIRGEGEKALRNEQKQLSHMDDHIRRLREQLQSLQLAEVELDALEEEHYDDRKQAEREVERLQKLVVELQDAVQAQRAEFAKHKKSYALVPYKHGANGTYRRPIYLECVKAELIMQPEGVSVTEDDLRPPMGAGNPLAAALRAARDHIVRLYPEEGKSRDTEPYPLMIVRPEGAAVAMRARRAIDAGDFDFGIEYVEADWKLKYPAPDPKLAELAQIAIDQARVRQEVLAEAAPRAFSRGGMASSGEFEYGDEPGGLRRGPVYEVRRKQGTGGGSGRYGEGGDEFGGGDGGDGDIGSGGGEFGGTAGSGLDGGAGGGLQYASGGAGPSGSEGGAQSAGGNSANAMSGSGGGSGEGGTDGGYGVASGGVPGGPAPSGTTVGGAGSIAGGPASSG